MNRSSSLTGVSGDLAGVESCEVADVEETGGSGEAFGLGLGRGRGRDVEAIMLGMLFGSFYSRKRELAKVGSESSAWRRD